MKREASWFLESSTLWPLRPETSVPVPTFVGSRAAQVKLGFRVSELGLKVGILDSKDLEGIVHFALAE